MSQTTKNKNYKATFILDTRNYTDPVESLIEKLTKTIQSIEGEVKAVKNMGQKAFVRITDKKFPAGIYLSMDFEGPASAPNALKEKLRLDKTVYRILVQAA